MNGARFAWAVGLVLAGAGARIGAADEGTGSAAGRQLFMDYCASCHGSDAKGHGAAAPGLKNQPADLTQLTRRHGGSFPRPEVILAVDGRDLILAHGTREMPIWGQALKHDTLSYGEEKLSAKIAAIVDYLETIQTP